MPYIKSKFIELLSQKTRNEGDIQVYAQVLGGKEVGVKYKAPNAMIHRLNGRVNADTSVIEIIADEVCRDLAEHPIVPTDEQIREMQKMQKDGDMATFTSSARWWVTVWQRRMFLAPEPSVPEEIRDLLYTDSEVGRNGIVEGGTFDNANQRIIDAYNRGLKESR